LERAGRPAEPEDVERLVAMLDRIGDLPGFEDDQLVIDTSLDANREISLRWFAAVGFDQALAEALWSLDLEPEAWPVYTDAADVVRSIAALGVSTALVSDFHADLRPHLRDHGIELDAYVISFEHGFQKPDRRMFLTALELLDVTPDEALMVGDRLTHDGGAAAASIDTVLLPQPPASGARGLDVVLGMLA
jgi:HAD superfamily hydrolase (TIGR01549 family)